MSGGGCGGEGGEALFGEAAVFGADESEGLAEGFAGGSVVAVELDKFHDSKGDIGREHVGKFAGDGVLTEEEEVKVLGRVLVADVGEEEGGGEGAGDVFVVENFFE